MAAETEGEKGSEGSDRRSEIMTEAQTQIRHFLLSFGPGTSIPALLLHSGCQYLSFSADNPGILKRSRIRSPVLPAAAVLTSSRDASGQCTGFQRRLIKDLFCCRQIAHSNRPFNVQFSQSKFSLLSASFQSVAVNSDKAKNE